MLLKVLLLLHALAAAQHGQCCMLQPSTQPLLRDMKTEHVYKTWAKKHAVKERAIKTSDNIITRRYADNTTSQQNSTRETDDGDDILKKLAPPLDVAMVKVNNLVVPVSVLILLLLYLMICVIQTLQQLHMKTKSNINVIKGGSKETGRPCLITIVTGCRPGASLQAGTVNLTFRSTWAKPMGITIPCKLETGQCRDHFERNRADTFLAFLDDDIGNYNAIEVDVISQEKPTHWYLAFIRVTDLQKKSTRFLTAFRWLTTSSCKLTVQSSLLFIDTLSKKSIFLTNLLHGFNYFHLWMSIFSQSHTTGAYSRRMRATLLFSQMAVYMFSTAAIFMLWENTDLRRMEHWQIVLLCLGVNCLTSAFYWFLEFLVKNTYTKAKCLRKSEYNKLKRIPTNCSASMIPKIVVSVYDAEFPGDKRQIDHWRDSIRRSSLNRGKANSISVDNRTSFSRGRANSIVVDNSSTERPEEEEYSRELGRDRSGRCVVICDERDEISFQEEVKAFAKSFEITDQNPSHEEPAKKSFCSLYQSNASRPSMIPEELSTSDSNSSFAASRASSCVINRSPSDYSSSQTMLSDDNKTSATSTESDFLTSSNSIHVTEIPQEDKEIGGVEECKQISAGNLSTSTVSGTSRVTNTKQESCTLDLDSSGGDESSVLDTYKRSICKLNDTVSILCPNGSTRENAEHDSPIGSMSIVDVAKVDLLLMENITNIDSNNERTAYDPTKLSGVNINSNSKACESEQTKTVDLFSDIRGRITDVDPLSVGESIRIDSNSMTVLDGSLKMHTDEGLSTHTMSESVPKDVTSSSLVRTMLSSSKSVLSVPPTACSSLEELDVTLNTTLKDTREHRAKAASLEMELATKHMGQMKNLSRLSRDHDLSQSSGEVTSGLQSNTFSFGPPSRCQSNPPFLPRETDYFQKISEKNLGSDFRKEMMNILDDIINDDNSFLPENDNTCQTGILSVDKNIAETCPLLLDVGREESLKIASNLDFAAQKGALTEEVDVTSQSNVSNSNSNILQKILRKRDSKMPVHKYSLLKVDKCDGQEVLLQLERTINGENRKCLCSFMLYVVYFVSLTVAILALLGCVNLGLPWYSPVAYKWLSCMGLAVIQNILLTEPFKILTLAFYLAFVQTKLIV